MQNTVKLEGLSCAQIRTERNNWRRIGGAVAWTRTKVEVSTPSTSRSFWLHEKHACGAKHGHILWLLLLSDPATAPWADELDLPRASVDLPFLDLPQLFLAHRLHLVRLRDLISRKGKRGGGGV